MNEQAFSPITIKALMRLYQVGLKPNDDGSYSGHIPWSILPDAKLTLSADGASWSTVNGGIQPEVGDRLEFIMRMEQTTRERALELLYTVYPDILKRERIPEEG